MTDHEYIVALRENDQRTIAVLYELYRDDFCARIGAKYRTLNRHLLTEVYIMSVTRLWEFIQRGKLSEQNLTKPLSHYLYGIGKLVVLETQRRNNNISAEQWRKIRIEFEEEFRIDIAYEDRLRQIRQVVDHMGKPCEPLLRMVYWEKLSMDAIAAELNYKNADSAKTQKYKCVEKLKRIIRQQP